MRTIRFLLVKEFKQIFRNKSILALIMVMPVMQLIVMPLAADYEIKNINLSISDHDHSTFSSHLVSDIVASGYFKLTGYSDRYADAMNQVEHDKADLVLEIPAGFENRMMREQNDKLFVAVNAINGVKANLGAAYLGGIIQRYNQKLRMELVPNASNSNVKNVNIESSNWYNEYLNYRVFMVPGILAILVTMIGGFLSALNIVKEKEVGTIEQINVTPIKKHQFILGKLLPFWILGNVVFSIGLVVSYVVYGIVPLGNIGVLYTFLSLYLMTVLGFGFLVSSFSETQQQAMFIMFFFMMVFILMGGLFTPIESMPSWAQKAAQFNPMTYLIDVMRMVIMKGSGLKHITHHMLMIACFALVLNVWAIRNYKKVN
jgi:ABC-2 type transport system permease protein